MSLSEKELAKLKKATYTLMCQDRQRLLVRFPFTGGFLMRMEFVPVRDCRLRTAATDGERIFMDIAFCSTLSTEERLFVMAHEVWHCVLMHMLRCQTRDPPAFNVAADMEVNRMLKKEGLKHPSKCLMPKAEWYELSAEEIYEHLRKRPKQGKQEQDVQGTDTQDGDGIGSDKQFDKHIYPSTSSGEDNTFAVTDQWGEVGFDKDYAPLITKELADKIRERIVAVAQQIERTRGTIPEHLANIVRAALRPQIRWQEVLAQFVTSCYGGSRRWLPPNRRHISQGLYLQSSRKERLQAAVAIDTSGSTTADLPQFFSELTSLLNTFGDYELTVMQCDCEIQNVEKFDAYNPFHPTDWKAYGHGGTDFRPPFVYVAEHSEIEPSCLIYITDGCGPAPDNPPPYPVLWILTGDGEKPAPWGWDLRLRQS
jgi:predicted metal-dependent peptidase